MPDSEANKKNTRGPRRHTVRLTGRIQPVFVAAMLFLVIGGGDFWVEKLNSRHIVRIGVPDSQSGRYMEATLEKWDPKAHGNIELQAVPLGYEELFNAASQGEDAPFDIVMIDDPWLAQLAGGKLAPVPIGNSEIAGMLTSFAPEFLRVSYYNAGKTPRRPEMSRVVKPGQTHPDARLLKDLNRTYTLYALPYVGNVQAIVRHMGASGRDDYDTRLANQTADWPTIEKMLTGGNTQFFTRLGSNNSALADYLPLLWAEGGCLVGRNSSEEEVSGLSHQDPAVTALRRSLRLANGHIQYARFQDEEVHGYLQREPDSIGISWMAFRSRASPDAAPGQFENTRGTETMWYLMPRATDGVKAVAPCDKGEERISPMNERRTGALGAWLLAVDSRSRQKEKAWEVIAWALEDLRNTTIRDAPGQCADTGAIEPVRDGDRLKGFPSPFEDQLSCGARMAVRHARPRPAHPKWNEIESAVGFRVRQAHWRTKTPEEAVHCASQDLDQILGEPVPATASGICK